MNTIVWILILLIVALLGFCTGYAIGTWENLKGLIEIKKDLEELQKELEKEIK